MLSDKLNTLLSSKKYCGITEQMKLLAPGIQDMTVLKIFQILGGNTSKVEDLTSAAFLKMNPTTDIVVSYAAT